LSQQIYAQTAAQHPDFNIQAQLAANDAAAAVSSASTNLSKRNKVSSSGLGNSK
jgi:hypothetical protein